MDILGGLVKSLLPAVPRPLVERVATRYVAGATLESALAAVHALNSEGASATVDILGEFVGEADSAQRACEDYLELVDAIRSSGVDSTVSVKLSMLGLTLDEALCIILMQRLLDRAASHGVFITIDMEDHSVTESTLRIYRQMRIRFENVGCVLQAYLHRTLADARMLPPSSNVRLCKGIYVEPEELAYKGRQEVRDNYVAVLEALLDAGHYVGIATHDDWLITRALETIERRGPSHDAYEFQMLLGVKPALRRRLIAAGHRLRVYVPYGRDWYPYSLRRLRENPRVALQVLRAMLGGR